MIDMAAESLKQRRKETVAHTTTKLHVAVRAPSLKPDINVRVHQMMQCVA